MCGDAGEVEAGRHHLVDVDVAGRAFIAQITLRFFEPRHEFRFDVPAADLLDQLRDARGVVQHLHGLDAGDVVEEPAAAREHEHRIALHLEQAQHARDLHAAQGVAAEELVQRRFRAVEDDVDVVVARAPRIAAQSRSQSSASRNGPRHF